LSCIPFHPNLGSFAVALVEACGHFTCLNEHSRFLRIAIGKSRLVTGSIKTAADVARAKRRVEELKAELNWLEAALTLYYGDGSGERLARVAHEKSCCASTTKVTEPAAACGCS
jgi:hypothetical protein